MSMTDKDIKRFIEDYQARIDDLERQITESHNTVLKSLLKVHRDMLLELSRQIMRCGLTSGTDSINKGDVK